MSVAHWDDVEWHRRAKGAMDASWQRLGGAAGTSGVGVNRVRVAPGKLPTPPHSHGASEELYFVLAGSGLAWQDEQVHEVRPRDCVIHRADEHEHTFIGGPEGLEYIVFGTRHPTEIGWLPRSRAIRIGWPWVEGRDDDPWDTDAEAAELEHGEPSPRPDNILNVDEVELEDNGTMTTAPLATRERSEQSGLHWEQVAPGKHGSVPHCHSEEEEVFVILEGEGTLELWPSPLREARGVAPGGHCDPSRPRDRPAAGNGRLALVPRRATGLTMLIYGTRRPNDMAWYPRSNKIAWRGLGVMGRIEALDYDDGEPPE